jgi:glycosyltransferase involved in cell wall biosynthesis
VTPVVSVIVPVFNGAAFLGEALDSVFAQDHRPLEVIVIDDGSSDDSAAIAATREVLVIRQEQRGVAAARNVGIAASTAPIIALLDQDDLWLPTKLSRQVEALLAHPLSVSMVLQEFFLAPPLTTTPKWFARPELVNVPHAGWAPSCLAFMRETYGRVGPFDERFAQASDSDWVARAKALDVEFELIDELLVRRRIHDANDSGSPTAMKELLIAMRNAAARRRQSSKIER